MRVRARQAAFRAIALLLSYALAIPAAIAADLTDGLVSPKDVLGKSHGSEYVSGDFSHPVLMQINLWGGVTKPGIHYVPVHTDLITLLSYAGGPTDRAELGEVVIKRKVMIPAPSLGLADLAPGRPPTAQAAPPTAASDGTSSPATPVRMVEKEETLHVNLNDYMTGRQSVADAPTLQANDIVMVPVSAPLVSNDTIAVMTILGTLASIVVAGVLVSQQIHH